jgi:phospholipase/carboxylesterase
MHKTFDLRAALSRPQAGGVDMNRRSFMTVGLAALHVPWLAGCLERGNGEVSDGDPRLTSRPAFPIEPAPLGATQVDLEIGRDAILYVPESYQSDTPMPLLITLHGAGGSAASWEPYYEICEARGVIMLAVDSRDSTWDRVRGVFGPDVWFIDTALAWTFERCFVDPTHIALAGFSDGASYALSLGVSNGDLLTHLIAFSPGFMAPTDPIVGSPKVFVSHGVQDAVLSVENTQNVILPSLLTGGYDVTYEEFAGGHNVPRSIGEQAFDWFLG